MPTEREEALPRFFAEGSTEAARRQLCGTSRNAVALSREEGWQHSLTIPPDAVLDVAFGLACPNGEKCAGGARFRMAARQGGGSQREILLERRISRPRDRCWEKARVDLHHMEGEYIDLALNIEMSTPATGSAENEATPIALWAEPLWVHRPKRPYYNVILISIDTLRADHLGCYGYPREISPRLDALAAEGVRFSQAISQSPWTVPSQMSLMTSLYPSSHQVNQGYVEFMAYRREEGGYRVLPKKVPTLARALRENGYRTVALTGGASVSAELGFSHGFDVYRREQFKLTEEVWPSLVSWLDEIEFMPFFLFFHTFEVHTPYTRMDMARKLLTEAEIQGLKETQKRYRGKQTWPKTKRYLEERGLYKRDVIQALYDGGIRHTDSFMGLFFEELKRRGLYNRTLIVVYSDHGEELGDHDLDPENLAKHGHSLYDELVHVPLIFRMHGELESGVVIDRVVELVDVTPTILDLVGIPTPKGMQGRSLKDLMGGNVNNPDEWSLSEATGKGFEMKGLRSNRYKYIAAFEPVNGERSGIQGSPVWEKMFDLERDPQEQRSIASEEAKQFRLMRRRLIKTFAKLNAVSDDGETIAISEEMEKELRALGYIN